MTSASTLFRSLIIYCVCIPLAVILGYLMANPFDLATFGVMGVLFFLLLTPLLLKWHHTWLIASWNMSMVLFFLPGRPDVWLAMAWLSLLIGLGQYILNRNLKFLYVPAVGKSLLFLAVVVLVTAKCTGGIGVRAFGGDTYGGKRYLIFLSAIIGYFAMTSQQIPPQRAVFIVALFFLGALTQAIGDMGAFVSPAFYFIFLLFPVGSLHGMAGEPLSTTISMARFSGSAFACAGVLWLMLSRHRIQDIITWQRPGRLLIFLAALALSTFGGFRSVLILFVLTFGISFYLEGLFRSRLLPVLLLCTVFAGAVLMPFTNRLPLSVQRTLSFLPLTVDPVAQASAQDSTQWRLMMWKHLIPQIPDYLMLGKGYAINGSDLEMVKLSNSADPGYMGAELAGDYHNGPLSVIIPFGIFGAIGFIWFLIAGLRTLHHNYYYGNPAYRQINRFLFAYFIARAIFFFVIFGSFYSDMAIFTGIVGLSVSLNGGMAKPALAPQPHPVFNRFKFNPAVRKPVEAS